jgi:hypothetical protein
MKCSLCGKKGVTLAHWRTAHKDWLRRKMNSPAARAKAAATRRRHAAEEGKGERPKSKRSSRAKRTALHSAGHSEVTTSEDGTITIVIRR